MDLQRGAVYGTARGKTKSECLWHGSGAVECAKQLFSAPDDVRSKYKTYIVFHISMWRASFNVFLENISWRESNEIPVWGSYSPHLIASTLERSCT